MQDTSDCLRMPLSSDRSVALRLQFSADVPERMPLASEVLRQGNDFLLLMVFQEGLLILSQLPAVRNLAGAFMFDYLEPQGILCAFCYRVSFPLGHAGNDVEKEPSGGCLCVNLLRDTM